MGPRVDTKSPSPSPAGALSRQAHNRGPCQRRGGPGGQEPCPLDRGLPDDAPQPTLPFPQWRRVPRPRSCPPCTSRSRDRCPPSPGPSQSPPPSPPCHKAHPPARADPRPQPRKRARPPSGRSRKETSSFSRASFPGGTDRHRNKTNWRFWPVPSREFSLTEQTAAREQGQRLSPRA